MALIAAIVGTLAGCSWSPVEPYAGEAPRTKTLYVIAAGWHTEIGIPAEAMTGPLASLKQVTPDAEYFVFGWGERDYYMSPNPDLGDTLDAAFPAPAVMLVIPLDKPPAEFFAARVFALRVSGGGIDRLSQFLWSYLATGSDRTLHRLGDGPYAGSSFYDSRGTYSLANTCNTWTAEALHTSGLPISPTGVVFADGVVDQVRRLSKFQEEPPS